MKHIVAVLALWSSSITFATPNKRSQISLLSSEITKSTWENAELRARGTLSNQSRASSDCKGSSTSTASSKESPMTSSKNPSPTQQHLARKRQATQLPQYESYLSGTDSQTQEPAAKRQKMARVAKTASSTPYQGPPIFKPSLSTHTKSRIVTPEMAGELRAEPRPYQGLRRAQVGTISETEPSYHRDMVRRLGIYIRPGVGGIPGQHASNIRKFGQAYHPPSIYRFSPQEKAPRPGPPISLPSD